MLNKYYVLDRFNGLEVSLFPALLKITLVFTCFNFEVQSLSCNWTKRRQAFQLPAFISIYTKIESISNETMQFKYKSMNVHLTCVNVWSCLIEIVVWTGILNKLNK